MVPDLALEAELRLETITRAEVRKAISDRPKEVENLTISLALQSARMDSIIRKAPHYIGELEAREAIGQKPSEVDWLKVAREMKPRPWWVRAAWAVMPSRRSVRL